MTTIAPSPASSVDEEPSFRLPFHYVAADNGHLVVDAEGRLLARCEYKGVAESIVEAVNLMHRNAR